MTTTKKKNKQENEPITNQGHTTLTLNNEIIPFSEIQNLLQALQTDEQGHLQGIKINEEVFKKIRESLLVTIKHMEKNPSLLSRAAAFWGQLPLWQKILGGVVLTLPTLILGLCFNIGFLLAICGVTAVIYTGSGILLNDHHHCSANVRDSLAQGVMSLADVLELTINALSNEIDKLSTENILLKNNVDKLASEIDKFSHENVLLKELTTNLEQTSLNMQELSTANQQLLEDKTTEHLKALEELKMINAMLEVLRSALMGAICTNKEEQLEFQKRLSQFLANKEASFDTIAKRICKAEQNLQENNAHYEMLLSQNAEQIKDLTAQISDLKQQINELKNLIIQIKEPVVVKNGLATHGVFAKNDKNIACHEQCLAKQGNYQ